MPFDYEKSVWGEGEAGLSWSSPASFRLRQALRSLEKNPNGGKVLEIGCGAGQFIRGIKKIKPRLECYGCDISQSAIDSAKKIGGEIIYSLSESSRLPYKDGFFDAVLVFDVLEHVDDVNGILSEIKRVLKIGGVFYCFVPCEGDFFSLWNLLRKLGIKKDLTKKYAGHINYFSRKNLLSLFHSFGFKESKIRYSEHVLGQIVGVASFSLMDRAAKKQGISQMNNEKYFSGLNGKGMGILKKTVNSLIYFESMIFSGIPSPNMHITLIKSEERLV